MELYRYRSFKYGLKEIKDQTIYFAAREETNDPTIEGYVEIYWKGDVIAWNGLFRNYVCSLYRALISYIIGIEEEKLSKISAIEDVHGMDDVPIGKIFKSLGDKFLQQSGIVDLANTIGENKSRVSKDEITFLLFSIHPHALKFCLEALPTDGLDELQIRDMIDFLDGKSKFIPSVHYRKFLEESPENRQEFMHSIVSLLKDATTAFYMALGEPQRKAGHKIFFDFPSSYVANLEEFIHPKVYFACFSADGANGAMWGRYAENHTGICMVYDTHLVNGNDTISIMPSHSSSTHGEICHYRDEKVYSIQYGGKVREANFFTMLGRFTGEQLYSWLADENGNRSSCLNEIYDNEDAWKDEYWQCLYDRYCHKTKEWEYENEYRLLLVSTSYDLDEKACRIRKYHFSNLKGIILGMKIDLENRRILLDAINEKCRETGRTDFKLWIAEFDSKKGAIVNRELSF